MYEYTTIAGFLNSKKISKYTIIKTIVVVLYVYWAFIFIQKTTIRLNGMNYHLLFDDAMISMRYALNFVHGNGLVWNPGEYVEGYTNPAWTLIMSLAISLFGKNEAPLIIQYFALSLVLLTIYFVNRTANHLYGDQKIFSVITIIFVVIYYPLSYWALLGMEVSAITLLISIAIYLAVTKPETRKTIVYIWLLLSIAFLIRPDGFLAMLPIFLIAIRNYKKSEEIKNLLPTFVFGSFIFIISILIIIIPRVYIYQELLPNTYVLKITNYSLIERITNGIGFIKPYILSISLAMTIALYGIKKNKDKNNIIFISLFIILAVAICYQIYVGGDPWNYWRQLTPSIIGLSLLVTNGIYQMSRKRNIYIYITIAILFVATIIFNNTNFWGEIFFKKHYYQNAAMAKLIRKAVVLNQILPNGRIMVFWAGILPYYYNGYAIDALGKSDKYIAKLNIDKSVSWNGMKGVPGHSKHDLMYSADIKKADFVQGLRWGDENIIEYTNKNFVAVSYYNNYACVRKNSKRVKWKLVTIKGRCVDYEDKLF